MLQTKEVTVGAVRSDNTVDSTCKGRADRIPDVDYEKKKEAQDDSSSQA